MNQVHFPNDPAGVFCSFHIPDFGVTWAGANPFGDGFCFGSETGRIAFTDLAGITVNEIVRASASGEAVNGAAFSQDWLAVTTRKDINFIGPVSSKTKPPSAVTCVGGGRDVVVAPTSGYFIIPLGPDGVMFVKPGTADKDRVTIHRSEKPRLNFTRVIALAGGPGNDVVVCAGRGGGLGYADYREGIRGQTLHTAKFKDLDFVDVCSLATPEAPLAVAAAAKDGSLVLFNNVLADKTPQTMKFKGVKGIVYRVLSAQGDIYLLTSKGLFGLPNLAVEFLKKKTPRYTIDVLGIPIEAADANTVGNKWLLAVGVADVFRFDIEKIPKSPSNGMNGEVWEKAEQDSSPHWEESGFEQLTENMSATM